MPAQPVTRLLLRLSLVLSSLCAHLLLAQSASLESYRHISPRMPLKLAIDSWITARQRVPCRRLSFLERPVAYNLSEKPETGQWRAALTSFLVALSRLKIGLTKKKKKKTRWRWHVATRPTKLNFSFDGEMLFTIKLIGDQSLIEGN